MHRWGPSLERYFAANPPVYTVRINGIEYVHIHPGPQAAGSAAVSGAVARRAGSVRARRGGRVAIRCPGGWQHRRACGRRRSAIFLLAAASGSPRLDAYVTIDESRWVQRAADFSALHRAGRPDGDVHHRPPRRDDDVDRAARDGAGASAPRSRSCEGRDRRHPPRRLLRRAGRRAPAVRGGRRARRGGRRRCSAGDCSEPGPALVGGLLLALEPFLVAHARVVHLDSGLTIYMAVAALAALVYLRGRRRHGRTCCSSGARDRAGVPDEGAVGLPARVRAAGGRARAGWRSGASDGRAGRALAVAAGRLGAGRGAGRRGCSGRRCGSTRSGRC